MVCRSSVFCFNLTNHFLTAPHEPPDAVLQFQSHAALTPPQCHLVIAKPQISVSTKAVYGKLRVNEIAPEEHPDIDGMMAAIKNGDLDGVIERLGNVLETVTVPDHPEIARIKEMMMENGACGSLMSGSGPTVFGIYKDKELAEKACQALREADGGRLTRQVYLTEFYNRKKAR